MSYRHTATDTTHSVVVGTPVATAGVGSALRTAFVPPYDTVTNELRALLDQLD